MAATVDPLLTPLPRQCALYPRVQRFRVVIFGAFGGRLDQEAQNINTLYSDGYRSSFAQIVLLSDECVASLLLSGECTRGERRRRWDTWFAAAAAARPAL